MIGKLTYMIGQCALMIGYLLLGSVRTRLRSVAYFYDRSALTYDWLPTFMIGQHTLMIGYQLI